MANRLGSLMPGQLTMHQTGHLLGQTIPVERLESVVCEFNATPESVNEFISISLKTDGAKCGILHHDEVVHRIAA